MLRSYYAGLAVLGDTSSPRTVLGGEQAPPSLAKTGAALAVGLVVVAGACVLVANLGARR